MYKARHRRRPDVRRRLKSVTTVAAVTASALLAPIAFHGPTPVRADVTAPPENMPEWVRATTVINPPAPVPGEAVAPPVPQSYVITGDALSRYDVTATALAQQEIADFAVRIRNEHSIALDPTKYRVYAMPPISATRNAAANANLAELVQTIQTAAKDSATVPALDPDENFLPVVALGNATPETVIRLVSEASVFLNYVMPDVREAESLILRVITDLLSKPLPDPSATVEQVEQAIEDNGVSVHGTDPMEDVQTVQRLIESFDALGRLQELLDSVDPVAEVEKIRAAATAIADEVVRLTDPAALLAMLGQIVQSINVDALLSSAGLPSSGEVAEDPAHASPVGTDVVTDTYGGVLGDVLVLPVGVGVSSVGAAYEDGAYAVSTLLETTPAAGAAPVVAGLAQYQPPGSDPAWEPAGGIGCMSRKQNNTAWYDPCSFWYTLGKDGNPNRLTWGLNQFGTAKSKSVWDLDHFEVKSWRVKGSPDQDWLDWSPRADVDHGNCSTGTVAVEVRAITLEHSSTQCDKWDIDKGSEPADFANVWRNPGSRVRRTERDVDSLIATNTPNGYYPRDYARFDYYAY